MGAGRFGPTGVGRVGVIMAGRVESVKPEVAGVNLVIGPDALGGLRVSDLTGKEVAVLSSRGSRL